MTHKPMQAGRKFLAVFLAGTLCALGMAEPLLAQSRSGVQDAGSVEARVKELYARNSEIQVELADGTVLRGRIIRVEADSFTVRQERPDREVTLQYAQVSEVRKKGLSAGAKVAVIAAIVGAGVLLVFCAAPFPIGFLCREDPS